MSRKKHEEHENHERWLVSYADFITLLFAFFTVLYATAQTDQQKLEAVIDSLNAAFNGGMPHAVFASVGVGTANVGLIDPRFSTVSDTTTMVESMRRGLRGSLSDNVVQVGLVNQTLQVALPERIAFAAGSAELHPSAFGILSEVARVVGPTPAKIRVVGHADGTPVKPGSPFEDNWALAAARAVSAVRYLEKRGIEPVRLVAAAAITADRSDEGRAITIHIDLDQPALGAALTDDLERNGLIAPPK
ncbi:MAG: flagellar motor protein MotB [Myxococcota bacterium]